MYKNIKIMTEVRFDSAYGVYGVRVAGYLCGIKYFINKCSSRCVSIFYDNTTLHDLLCHGIRTVPTWAQCFNDGLTTTAR